MDKSKIITLSKIDCIRNGRKQTGFKLPIHLNKDIEHLKAINDAEFYVMHSCLLDLGIKELLKMKSGEDNNLIKEMMNFRQEDKGKMRPKSYSINLKTSEELVNVKDRLTIPTIIEAHYIALKLGLKQFKKLK